MAISITKPVVGGDENTWGTKLNTALDVIVDASNGTSGTIAPDLSTLTINSTNVTATAAELNVVDGDTAATATTVVGADRVVFNDNGTMKQVSLADINTYIQSQAAAGGNGQITISAGNAITGGGTFTVNQAGNSTVTLDHQDTSSQSSVNNSGQTFIQDITLDTYGHVTGINSATASSGVTFLASGTQSASSSGGGNFTISTGVANKSFLIRPTFYSSNLSGAGPFFGTTDGSGNISAQVSAVGNNQSFTVSYVVF
jgi:hypothetical protein|tara:strand:- start:286 stop:1056 length:771 start_codon:yes stop_codon:yes gene_type:complete